MNKKTNYIKVASYEALAGKTKKVLLLYSGGLDTSVMLKWIQDKYKCQVVTLTADLGQQHDNLEIIRNKALKFGAIEAVILDLKDEFAENYISLGIKANASYQGNYHLSTPMGRAVLGKEAVRIAKKYGCDAIAHGCTGKGNDQVRFDSYILVHDPNMKILAPVREWNMDRNQEIAYAQKYGIPIPASIDVPYSDDDNMWGITWEGGEITDPSLIIPVEKFLTTYTLPENAPNKPEFVNLGFEKGVPVSIGGKKIKLATLIKKLNHISGKHGVGTFHVIEDRMVGLKNRGVYEHPGAHVIIEAHKSLEKYVSTRDLNELKDSMDIKWAYLCYGAKFFDPTMDAINAFNKQVNKKVTGEVIIKLFKGQVTIVAVKSPYSLDYASFNNNQGYSFNTNTSAGFIEVYSLQMRLANQIKDK